MARVAFLPLICLALLGWILLLGVRHQGQRISNSTVGGAVVTSSRMLMEERAASASTKSPWDPVDCLAHRQKVQTGEIYDPNDGELFARWTTTNPPFFASLHHFGYDKMRRVVYEKGEYYETSHSEVFKIILRDAPPNSRVLDVGGNIGWFSLLSASLGHHVDVFEPNPANVLRLCESMRLNRWEAPTTEREIVARTSKRGSVHVRQAGVGASATEMTFFVGSNPGKATVLRSMLPKWRKVKESTIRIAPLDEIAQDLKWIENNAVIALLKVDVEGYEPSVFAGAKKLLRAGLIQNIVMEVTIQPDNSENEEMLQTIVDAGYRPYQKENAMGKNDRQQAGFPPGDENFAKVFLQGMKRGKQLNIWFKKAN